MPHPPPSNGTRPATTGNPAVSGSGSGMGAGQDAGPGRSGGVQAGTINDATQGSPAGSADDPSLGSGMAIPGRGNRMGDAATGGGSGIDGAAAAPIEPFELPYKVTGSPGQER